MDKNFLQIVQIKSIYRGKSASAIMTFWGKNSDIKIYKRIKVFKNFLNNLQTSVINIVIFGNSNFGLELPPFPISMYMFNSEDEIGCCVGYAIKSQKGLNNLEEKTMFGTALEFDDV